MENNINKENKYNYNSILQKINHKPLLVENIFPYIKNEPFKFLHLIEKDKTLKESINSQFFNVKKNNLFSKEINDNIKLLIFYKKYIEILRQYKNNDNIYLHKNDYEEYIIKNNSDPSFILYKSKKLFNLLSGDKSFLNPSLEGLFDITFNEQEQCEKIHLVFLPIKENYKDSFYIKKNLNNNSDLNKNNNCMNKEIDVLYCIIDDNEYYLNLNSTIDKNIIINEIYFIYIKGFKNINIYNAIEKYLNSLNKKNIKQISFGYSLYQLDKEKYINWDKNKISILYDKIPIMEIINDALVNNKKYTFPKNISINLLSGQYTNFKTNRLKYLLGIYFLFRGQNIDGIFELNSKSYNTKMIEKLNNSNLNTLIIKYNGLSSFDDDNFNKFVKHCLKINIPNIIFYIAKDKINNKKKNNEKLNFELAKDKNYFVYSEIPTKRLNLDKQFMCYQVIDSNNDIILQEINNSFNKINNNLVSHLFLLQKYNSSLCFKCNYSEEIYYKMFFVKNQLYYDLYIVNKSEKYYYKYHNYNYNYKYHNSGFDIKKIEDYETKVDFEEVINYCKNILNLKINKVDYSDFSLCWNDVLKNETQNKNKKEGSSKKACSSKMNQNQILEYELEDDDYYDEEEEDNDDFADDNN